jgi:hypothetical protein
MPPTGGKSIRTYLQGRACYQKVQKAQKGGPQHEGYPFLVFLVFLDFVPGWLLPA